MGRRGVLICTGLITAAALFLFRSAGIAEQPQKPKIAPPCKQCHAPSEDVLRGALANVSQKAETIQIQVGPATWLVKYDPEELKLVGAEQINKIPKEKEIAITIAEKEGTLYAVSLSVKPPAKIPDEKLVKVEELAKLVDTKPEKVNFTIVDSRPAPRYLEGHIPGAIPIYDAEFDKNVDKLPKEKDRLLIFYCAGVT